MSNGDTGSERNIGRMIRAAWSQDDPTGWFERVYASAANGDATVPWARRHPNGQLVAWMDREGNRGDGRRAVVVGCGLGDDAEYLNRHGFEVTAFDISPTAIAWCQKRFPESRVRYVTADLFRLPGAWRERFDLVVEINTIQALPYTLSDAVMGHIAALLQPGGTLVLICHGREPDESRHGIPWPLSRSELESFEQVGLIEEDFEDYVERGTRRFRVIYRKIEEQTT